MKPLHRRNARAHRAALRPGVACLLVLGAAAAQAAAGSAAGSAPLLPLAAPPAAGRYDARLCVAVAAAPPQCGPVAVDLGDAGQALVRVSDIAYRLEVYGERLGVTLFHGTMQIDGFFAQYQWSGSQLLFVDPDKSTRYELRLGARRFDAP
jgi:hypothetical protein